MLGNRSGEEMKTIGLLGGMSWESTVSYYQTINRVVGERIGGFHSAKILLHSVDFHDVERLQRAGRWEEAGELLSNAARALESAGAEFLILCTNTMHRVAPQIEASISIPFLHIADATAESISSSGLTRVGLLGTRFTMEQDFYRGRLEERHGLEVVVPSERDRESVHRIIFEELCRGQVLESSRSEYRRIISDLVAAGCEGVVLGCTEIGLLLQPSDASVPLFDTAEIHAKKAAIYALDEETAA
jgi:aspartate racemase